MQPRIQYAKTAGGVGIAFWTMGNGMSLPTQCLLQPALTETRSAHVRWEAQEPSSVDERGEGEYGL
jgi:hypothetical protein